MWRAFECVLHALQGLLGAYGLVLLVLLLLFLVTLRNCPAGICMIGFILNTLLVVFCLLPILYTILLLVMRDTCANVESVAVKAIDIKTGSNSTAAKVAGFYLGNGSYTDDGTSGLAGLIKGINTDFDVDALKLRVNRTIDDVVDGIKAQNITLAPLVSAVLSRLSLQASIC